MLGRLSPAERRQRLDALEGAIDQWRRGVGSHRRSGPPWLDRGGG